MIGVFAFTDGFKSIRQVLYTQRTMESPVEFIEDPQGFYENFDAWFGEWWHAFRTTYYVSLGGFDPAETDLYSLFTWPIFFLCSIFNIIILLNLLIAIVCDIFDRVLAQATENRYFLLAK